MNTTLLRRIEQLERAMPAVLPGRCFIMASDANAAEHEIVRLKAEFGERLPKTLFVMTLADRRDRNR
jgi:hypothetical protein